jgi:hypothetical protein
VGSDGRRWRGRAILVERFAEDANAVSIARATRPCACRRSALRRLGEEQAWRRAGLAKSRLGEETKVATGRPTENHEPRTFVVIAQQI